MSTDGPATGTERTRTVPGSLTSAETVDSDRTAHAPGSAVEEFTPRDFGQYKLLEVLGVGGMGWVYLAHDTVAGRNVALKMLPPGPHAAGANRKRFEIEFRAAAQLDHPNIVPVYDVDCLDNQLYFTMKYLEGRSLAQNRDRFKGDARAVSAIIAKIARALHFAHQKRILHRDMKPGNILLDAKGEPMISDFGLAKFLDAGEGLTMSDALVGTLPYMSPEQRAGRAREITFASDVYALGVTLHEMITGVKPNPDEDGLSATAPDAELLPATDRAQPELDPTLAAIVDHCLRKKPQDRYDSAEALAVDLERWLLAEPLTLEWPRRKVDQSRRRFSRRQFMRLAAGGGGLIALGGGAIAVQRGLNYYRKTGIQQELASGGADLLRGDGMPRFANPLMPGISFESATNDGEPILRVTSGAYHLLELVPNPDQEAFTLRADVRIENTLPQKTSLAGIYVGRHHFGSGATQANAAVTLGLLQPDQDKGRVLFKVQLCIGDPVRNCGSDGELLIPGGIAIDVPGSWHTLTLTFGPRAIQGRVDDRPEFEQTHAELSAEAGRLAKAAPLPTVEAMFRGTDGVGLFVSQGTASFRNVRIALA